MRIELVRDGWEVKQLAERRHGLDVSSATIGYAFVEDASIVAAVPTTAAGTVLHELFHLLVRSNFGDVPQWLDEGIAGLYEVSGRRGDVYFGLENWRRKVLETTWDVRPDLAELIRAEWFLFDAESESDIRDEEVVVYRTGPGGAWRWRKGDQVCVKQYMAREQAERAAAKANPNATIRVDAASAKRGREATKDAKPGPERDTAEPDATVATREAKPMSLLDAAAHLLSLGTGDNPGAMRCKDIVDLAVERGLWTPRDGKTPENTLYAAISREIKVKGEASRFVKAERGKFSLAPGMKKGA